MIPVRLELKNFLPYRSPDPVRFDGIHLACLTGSNGAGKSSLLDAITWALWGKARAKRDDDLVHLGQGEMYVQLDFEQEGVLYRVFRQRIAGKKGEGRLNFFILQQDGQRTLQNEPSMRHTQDKINALLRLDYETFIHSAFLQQGRADAFTTRTPAQRKQILSDILGLAQWADYEEVVKERQKILSGQIVALDERLKEIDSELARRPALEKDRADAQLIYEDARQLLDVAEARLAKVAFAPLQKEALDEKIAAFDHRLEDHDKELQEIQERLNRQRAQIAEYAVIIAKREEIEKGYTVLVTARETDQQLSQQLSQLKTIDDARSELVRQLDAARYKLQSEATSLQSSLEQWAAVADAYLPAELEAVQTEVNTLETLQAQRDFLADQISHRREDKARLEAEKKSLTQEGKDLRERLDTLRNTDTALCPLCGQPLEAEHLASTIAQLEADVSARRDAYRENQEAARALENMLKADRTYFDTLESELKRLSPLREKAGALQAQADAAQQAELRMSETHERLRHVQAELEADAFAPDVREALARLDEQRAQLRYDASTHDDTRTQLDLHIRFEKLQAQLQLAISSMAVVQESVTNAEARIERLTQMIEQINGEKAAALIEIARLEVLVEEYKSRDAEVKQERTRVETAHERLITAQQSLRALEAAAERRVQLEERLAKTRHQDGLLGELKRAFGKNGIPAMIIETAIPELEASANELLARMTDGRMALTLNTQREKVTGGMAETLDIDIADELGTRSYELYSGGEAFRINFAVRVALSQLLARRAGAQLRTLFIDEGFGTQDDEGRNKLVEAITAIQHEFDMILVITHIEELRDSFPVHIVVDKTGNGSRVAVR